jgi:folate-dependent phosphoribosylglycinamide formyltransferase PurN
MLKVKNNLINFSVKKNKYFYKDLNFQSKSRKVIKFKILSSIINEKYYSIIDYGSSCGDLYFYLKNKPLQYFGYEVNKKSFRIAKKKFSQKKNVYFYNSRKIKYKSDYIICSKLFSIKELSLNKEFYFFFKRKIKLFINNSYKGFSVVFNWDIYNDGFIRKDIFFLKIKNILSLIPKKKFRIEIIKDKKKNLFYILATRIENSSKVFVCNTRGTNIKCLIPELRNHNCLLIIFDNIKLSNLILKNKIKTVHIYTKKNKHTFNANLYLVLKKIKSIKKIFVFSRFLIFNKNLKLHKDKFINLHYSLLPKYKGLHGMRNSVVSKDKYIGCTLHYINKEIDSGKIIKQKMILNRGNKHLKMKKIFNLGVNLIKSNL